MQAPISLEVKFKGHSLEEFSSLYGNDLSNDGIFIRTEHPLGTGTGVDFQLSLDNESPLLSGNATVVFTERDDVSGMGLRFNKLSPDSAGKLAEILRHSEQETKATIVPQSEDQSRPIPLQVKLQSESLDDFVRVYGEELGEKSIFIRTAESFAIGCRVDFELLLTDGSPLFAGRARVVWMLKGIPEIGIASGVTLRFESLDGDNEAILKQALSLKSEAILKDVETQKDLQPEVGELSTSTAPEVTAVVEERDEASLFDADTDTATDLEQQTAASTAPSAEKAEEDETVADDDPVTKVQTDRPEMPEPQDTFQAKGEIGAETDTALKVQPDANADAGVDKLAKSEEKEEASAKPETKPKAKGKAARKAEKKADRAADKKADKDTKADSSAPAATDTPKKKPPALPTKNVDTSAQKHDEKSSDSSMLLLFLIAAMVGIIVYFLLT
jgi:uncharacterized protein (TIGR02266 family)